MTRVQSTRAARAAAPAEPTRPGIGVRMLCRLVRLRARLPGWELEVLRGLAASEAQGVAALQAVLPSIRDAELRRLVERHARDEQRHVMLFSRRLQQLSGGPTSEDPAVDASDAGPELPESVSGLNEVALLAMFEATEIRGHAVLATYRDLFAHDPDTLAVLDSVLADERFHVAYTHEQLERIAAGGRAALVRAARRWARRYERAVLRRQARAFVRLLPRLLACEIGRLAGRRRRCRR